MSELLINQYHAEIAKYIQYGGDKKETSIRRAFANLLTSYCKPHDLLLCDEIDYTTKFNTRIVPDGTIKDALRLTHGYWEAKDEYDDIDVEIEKKLKKGYPTDNILFEDSITAVLLQNNTEVMRVSMKNANALDKLVRRFIEFERPELKTFRQAIAQFKQDMPQVLHALRQMIDANQISNANFKTALQTFLKLCQDNINADIVLDDAREMLIQHILTEDIFNTVFGDTQFHRENNIARELQKVAETFFTGSTKKNTLKGLESYYGAIKQSASGIANHHEKQQFLKAIYENFYKVYNPKLADRLGVVYTPNEIVRFMIESTEALIHQHFGKLLISRGVEILDPATGTGTFITDLIEHFKHNPAELKYKYQNELHCNEVAILPYYIANLNIEFTYSQIMNEYAEFPHICFVDTLDNLGFDQKHSGAHGDLDFGMTAVNTERVKAQNAKKISVIIGNPPYNANQVNENDNNKNRIYGGKDGKSGIDKRIKETYIAESTAQKTKLYDMYARFLRWASDRLDENGVVAFITNRSFIDSRTFDGFRKIVAQEFNEVCIIDLGGDVRANPALSGTTHNVFGIQTGVAISFLVKNAKLNPPLLTSAPPQPSPVGGGSHVCRIRYLRRPEMETAEEKLSFLASNQLNSLAFQVITPDKNHNWINLSDNDFDSLIPVANKETKASLTQTQECTLFKLYTNGIVTARDEWVVDKSLVNLESKVRFFLKRYVAFVKDLPKKKLKQEDIDERIDKSIKWSDSLKSSAIRRLAIEFSARWKTAIAYRPYIIEHYYAEPLLSDRLTANHFDMFGQNLEVENLAIGLSGTGSSKPFQTLAINCLPSFDFLEKTQFFPLYRYDESGNRTDNITDWGLAQFVQYYGSLHQRGRAGVGESLGVGEVQPFNPPPLPAKILANARELRANMTDAEQTLWQAIRKEQLGVKFRKQHPMPPFILDFYCVEKKLAIELDGGQHNDAEAVTYDAKRSEWLKAQGIIVLRFWNNEVLTNLDGALTVVADSLQNPPPQPSPVGGGSEMVESTLALSAGGYSEKAITKQAIFHYVYAVLHDPIYREKYALNLKREFPRVPFYADFWQWANWGEALMQAHIGYETAVSFALIRTNKKVAKPKPKLKADKTKSEIILDEATILSGIPARAWDYKLGNRSALEWVLDQYKESKPKDPTIREKFNTYQFADYKEHVIELLAKVCTVSVQTQEIVEAMRNLQR